MSTERVAIERQTVVENSANNGLLRQFASVNELLRCNWAATTAPATTNDGTQGYQVGSLWLDTTNDNLWACMDSTTNTAIWRKLNSVFGDEFESFSSLTDSTTTSTTAQDKLVSTTAIKPVGTYLCWVEAQIRSSTANREFGLTFRVDKVVQHTEHIASTIRTNNNAAYHWSEFFMVTFASAIKHTLNVRFRAVGTSSTITINNVRIAIWRVA